MCASGSCGSRFCMILHPPLANSNCLIPGENCKNLSSKCVFPVAQNTERRIKNHRRRERIYPEVLMFFLGLIWRRRVGVGSDVEKQEDLSTLLYFSYSKSAFPRSCKMYFSESGWWLEKTRRFNKKFFISFHYSTFYGQFLRIWESIIIIIIISIIIMSIFIIIMVIRWQLCFCQ